MATLSVPSSLSSFSARSGEVGVILPSPSSGILRKYLFKYIKCPRQPNRIVREFFEAFAPFQKFGDKNIFLHNAMEGTIPKPGITTLATHHAECAKTWHDIKSFAKKFFHNQTYFPSASRRQLLPVMEWYNKDVCDILQNRVLFLEGLGIFEKKVLALEKQVQDLYSSFSIRLAREIFAELKKLKKESRDLQSSGLYTKKVRSLALTISLTERKMLEDCSRHLSRLEVSAENKYRAVDSRLSVRELAQFEKRFSKDLNSSRVFLAIFTESGFFHPQARILLQLSHNITRLEQIILNVQKMIDLKNGLVALHNTPIVESEEYFQKFYHLERSFKELRRFFIRGAMDVLSDQMYKVGKAMQILSKGTLKRFEKKQLKYNQGAFCEDTASVENVKLYLRKYRKLLKSLSSQYVFRDQRSFKRSLLQEIEKSIAILESILKRLSRFDTFNLTSSLTSS